MFYSVVVSVLHHCESAIIIIIYIHTYIYIYIYIYICISPLPFEPPSHSPIPPLKVVTKRQAVFPVLYSSFPLKKKVKVQVAQSCLTLLPHGLYSPWNSPGQNTGGGSLYLLQGIFPTQGSNSYLLHPALQVHSLPLNHQRSSYIYTTMGKTDN